MAELIQKQDTLNQGRVKLNAAITDAETAKVDAGAAVSTSNQAKQIANQAVDTSKQAKSDAEAALQYTVGKYLEPVDTFGDISTTYPNAETNDRVFVRDTGKVYILQNGTWQEFSEITAGPVNEVDKRLTAQVAETTTKISKFSIQTPETDDTSRFNRAVAHAIQNKNPLILDESLSISTNVTLPGNLTIEGNNSTITLNILDGVGMTIDGENVKIKNIILDGSGATRVPVYVKSPSKHVYFENVEVRNAYGNNFMSNGIEVKDGCDNVHITNSYIHDIYSKENGVIGDSQGAARGILFGAVTSCSVKFSKFDKIGGFEDGDSIQVQTVSGADGWSFSDVTIEGNYFYNITKRAVKLQASGIKVTDNKMYSEYVDGDNVPSSAIADYGNFNSIKGNKIYLLKAAMCIDLNNAKHSIIENNFMELDKAGAYEGVRVRGSQMSCITIINSEDVKINNNEFSGNTYKIYTPNFAIDLTIKGNRFKPATRTYLLLSGGSDTVTISGNEFLSSDNLFPYETVNLTNPTRVFIGGNTFGKTTIPVRFYGALGGVEVNPNTFIGFSGSIRYRTTDVTAGLETLKIIGESKVGRDTILAGEKSKTIAHGLGRLPVTAQVSPQHIITGGWRVNIDSSTFITIELEQAQSTWKSFYWRVE